MKPIIGVSGTQLLNPGRGFEGTLVAYTPQNYIDTVQGVGATPIMLPVGTAEDAKNMVALIDALILTGGHDVNPALYGEEPHRNLTKGNRKVAFFNLYFFLFYSCFWKRVNKFVQKNL